MAPNRPPGGCRRPKLANTHIKQHLWAAITKATKILEEELENQLIATDKIVARVAEICLGILRVETPAHLRGHLPNSPDDQRLTKLIRAHTKELRADVTQRHRELTQILEGASQHIRQTKDSTAVPPESNNVQDGSTAETDSATAPPPTGAVGSAPVTAAPSGDDELSAAAAPTVLGKGRADSVLSRLDESPADPFLREFLNQVTPWELVNSRIERTRASMTTIARWLDEGYEMLPIYTMTGSDERFMYQVIRRTPRFVDTTPPHVILSHPFAEILRSAPFGTGAIHKVGGLEGSTSDHVLYTGGTPAERTRLLRQEDGLAEQERQVTTSLSAADAGISVASEAGTL